LRAIGVISREQDHTTRQGVAYTATIMFIKFGTDHIQHDGAG
jgi:hypothetical protein